MNKIITFIILIFSFTSCISQKQVEGTFENKKSSDLSNDIEKYGTPNKIIESIEKGYKTCIWNNVDNKEISCDYNSNELRIWKREKPLFKAQMAATQSKKTDYENDIIEFGNPNDVSTYNSNGYYSKNCTWHNANGKYRSYDYNKDGKRTSTFESNPIK